MAAVALMIDGRAAKEHSHMNKHAIRTLIAAAVTTLALIAVGSANADAAAAGTSTQGRDISPWTVTHGR
ncbi:MAG TPA: hypothetical protein VF080_00710 [Solirubrobacteraceae bacterium]